MIKYIKNTILLLIILLIISPLLLIANAETHKIDIESDLVPNLGRDYGYNLNPEHQAVANLPDVTSEEAFSFAIKTVLEWSMILTIIAIVMAAIYYIQSLGNEEDLSKVKNIIIYLIIGMAIMAAAYGIISGVSQFNFFKAVE